MPTNTDVRKYRETVIEQGKVALGEARKPWLAAVGATNLAYGQLRTQLKELPADTQLQLKKLQDEAQAQLKKLQERAQDRATALEPAKVRKTVEEYAAQALQTYDTLADRGEKVVRKLRRDRRVRNAFAETEEFLQRTEEAVTGRPASTAPRATTASTTPRATTATTATTRSTASRTPARKAPARKATARS